MTDGLSSYRSSPIRELSSAFYAARLSIFGGTFPFTIFDAKDFIGDLAGEKGKWLADLCYYTAADYDPEDDFYCLYSAGAPEFVHGNTRTNFRARRRYQVFRDGFAEIQRDGLQDLAGAWWAFFIASQSIGFPGLGVPTNDLPEIAATTRLLLGDKRVRRAIELAIQIERERAESPSTRSTLAMLRELLAGSTLTSPGAGEQVQYLGMTPERAERYLSSALTPATWNALGPQSRRDLIEAEQLWCRVSPELGAGRSDWGALIALYSRPVEAELRANVAPLIDQLQRLNICQVRELTLGGCVTGIRNAYRALRVDPPLGVPFAVRDRVNSLHSYFKEHGGFLETARNYSNHGNREVPMSANDFLRWRIAIFEDRLFSVLLSK